MVPSIKVTFLMTIIGFAMCNQYLNPISLAAKTIVKIPDLQGV